MDVKGEVLLQLKKASLDIGRHMPLVC